jgi:hypothetical protein
MADGKELDAAHKAGQQLESSQSQNPLDYVFATTGYSEEEKQAHQAGRDSVREQVKEEKRKSFWD